MIKKDTIVYQAVGLYLHGDECGRGYQMTVTYLFPSLKKLGKGIKFEKYQPPNKKCYWTQIMEEYGAYLVIKILSPNRNLKEYECVPKNWVKVKDNVDNYVVFGYPLEDKLGTRLRVIEQPLDKKWPILYGEVVYNTDSQEEAFQFLERKGHKHDSDSNQSKDTSKQDDDKEIETTTSNNIRIKPITLSSKKTNRPSKRKQSEEQNIVQDKKNGNESEKGLELILLEADELIRTYASDVDNEEAVSSSTSNSSHNTQIPDTTQILPNETANGTEKTPVNKENTEKITKRPRRQSTRRTSNLSQGYLEFESSDEEFDRSDDSDYVPNTVRTVPSGVQSVNNSLDQDINMSLSNDQVHSHCYNFYVELNESYQKSMSILDNAADYLQKIISKHKDNVTSKAIQPPLTTNQQPDAINPYMFSHPQPLLQERSSCSEEDTKWTVKYPEPGPGIIELLPHSGVYVSEKGLNECKSINNETTKFTRSLLEEVFTYEALTKCSFSGVSRKKKVKPGLDLKAREIFVEYILQYSREMGWKKANPDIIMTCIRNRLQTLHRIG